MNIFPSSSFLQGNGPTVADMIVLYREGDENSYNFAVYYAQQRGLQLEQLIPIPCSSNEILDSYAIFQEEIENPLLNILSNEYLSDAVKVILVGYNVPGGFVDGQDIISTTSRLSRIYYTFTKGLSNPFYSRQQFQRYSEADSQTALIVSRIDAPTLSDATAIVDNIVLTVRQGIANGTLFFDPYAIIEDSQEIQYQSDLFDFETQLLPVLNLTEFRTTYWDAYTDVVIPRLSNDSFMWAFKSNRAGYSFFLPRTTSRVFLYNADTDGGAAVRDSNDKRWPMLALNAGYSATAGAMSDPLPEGFLRPKPFFDSLFRGATIGEAFLYSVPNLDWTITLFGDPLVQTKFPSAAVLISGYTTATCFDLMGRNLDNVMGFYLQREQCFIDIYNLIQNSQDIQQLQLLSPFASLANDVISRTSTDLNRVITQYVAFPINNGTQSFVQYLNTNNLLVSSLISTICPNIQVLSDLQYPFGYWDIDDTIQHPNSEFAIYNFQLQLANDENFISLVNTGVYFTSYDNLLLNADSSQNFTNWFYEKDSNELTNITATGVLSSYAGRRVRYVPPSGQYFSNRQIYYIRIRQINEYNEPTAWRTFKQAVGT